MTDVEKAQELADKILVATLGKSHTVALASLAMVFASVSKQSGQSTDDAFAIIQRALSVPRIPFLEEAAVIPAELWHRKDFLNTPPHEL